MRMQRRDINIFNLSMMDVISGAMGAFLIIMVMLMRYYKEDEDISAQREAAQKQMDEMERKIQEAIEQLQATTDLDVEELLRRLEELKRDLADARREVNRLNNDLQAARNRANQLQVRNDELERENQILKRRVEVEDTFVVQSTWSSATPVDVDVFIESTIMSDKKELLRFDPRLARLPMFHGDMRSDDDSTSGPDTWVINAARSNTTFKVFVYIYSVPPGLGDVSVTTQFAATGRKFSLDRVVLNEQKSWELVGILTTGDTGWTTVQPVTQADRDRERAGVNAYIQTTQPRDR